MKRRIKKTTKPLVTALFILIMVVAMTIPAFADSLLGDDFWINLTGGTYDEYCAGGGGSSSSSSSSGSSSSSSSSGGQSWGSDDWGGSGGPGFISGFDNDILGGTDSYDQILAAKDNYDKTKLEYMNTTDPAERAELQNKMDGFHNDAETARKNGGNYSGGADGSQYIPGSNTGGSYDWGDWFVSPPITPPGSISVSGVTLFDTKGNPNFASFKSGYGFSAVLDMSIANATVTSATATMSNGQTCQLEVVGNTLQFVQNTASPTNARRYYVPVETKDGTFTVTFNVIATDQSGIQLPAVTKTCSFEIKGTMYDDDYTGVFSTYAIEKTPV